MSSNQRLPALDVLRGIAILGTLATNIWIFTHPEGLVGILNGSYPLDGAWALAGKILQQLSQGKFLGLLSLMFGIGLALQRRSAVRSGRAWPGPYLVRAAVLFIDGVLHYLLVAEFDVLMGYAVTAVIVAWLLATRERSQRRWIMGAAAVHLLLLGLIVLALAAMGPPASAAPIVPNPYAEGSWWDLVKFRIDHVVLFRIEPVFIFFLSIALFLCGARLLEKGVLETTGSSLRRRLMWLGALVLPLDLLVGVYGGDAGLMASRYGTAPLVSLGVLALVAECYQRRPQVGFIGRRLSEIGRTALSCYVLQNLLASALCYGWGLGIATRIDGAQRVPVTLALYLLVSACILAFAHLWLRRFRRGPVEWLWQASVRKAGAARLGG